MSAVSIPTFLAAFFVAAMGVAGVWALSIPLRNVAIIDVWWGLGFVLMACVYASATNWTLRSVYITVLISIWAFRLSGYLYWRNHVAHHGEEDKRYAMMRANVGESFWWKSCFMVFLPQLIAQCLVGVPLLFAMQSPRDASLVTQLVHMVVPTPSEFGWLLDTLGLAVFAVGLYFEWTADVQLSAFKAKPENEGKLCTEGLWRATRHPNYFGSAMIWWGIWLMACAASGWGGVATVFAPAIMHYCLVAVTGVKLTEKVSTRKKPGFDEYAKETPAFFPDTRKLFS